MRSAIFDLDGTLAETAWDLIGALNAVLRDLDMPEVDAARARKTAGMGGKALLRYGFSAAGRTISEAELEARYPHFLEAYEGRLDSQTHLFDGVEACLDALAEGGWRLGVCTNKPDALAHRVLKGLGVHDRFHAVIGAGALSARKPDPLHLTETIRRAGGAEGRAVLIGDTATDRDAARNAGERLVLVSFGYALEPVADLGADAVVDHFDELAPTLERLLG